jgi:hypothetical protein
MDPVTVVGPGFVATLAMGTPLGVAFRGRAIDESAEVIVANTLDRFTRDEEQWFEFTKNVPVRIFTLDGVDTGTDDRLLSGIRVLIAADGRRKIYARTMSGRLARI